MRNLRNLKSPIDSGLQSDSERPTKIFFDNCSSATTTTIHRWVLFISDYYSQNNILIPFDILRNFKSFSNIKRDIVLFVWLVCDRNILKIGRKNTDKVWTPSPICTLEETVLISFPSSNIERKNKDHIKCFLTHTSKRNVLFDKAGYFNWLEHLYLRALVSDSNHHELRMKSFDPLLT